MAKWAEKPWVVANCDTGRSHDFSTRVEAESWIKRQNGSRLLILYPDSAFRILSAAEVREIQAIGATIFDDFGESNRA